MGRQAIEHQFVRAELPEPGGVQVSLHGRGGQQQSGPRIVEHEGDALGGVVGIERKVDRTGLEDGQHGDREVDAAVQCDGDAVLGLHAESDEMVREPIGPCIEFGVGQLRSAEGDGDGLGIARDLLLEQRRDRRFGCRLLQGGVGALQQRRFISDEHRAGSRSCMDGR